MDQVVADVRQVVDAELVTRGTSRRYGARSGGSSHASLKFPFMNLRGDPPDQRRVDETSREYVRTPARSWRGASGSAIRE
jgi:hypothetical protein